MEEKKKAPKPQPHLAMLLHGKTCPVAGRYLSHDCLECVQLYLERRGGGNGAEK